MVVRKERPCRPELIAVASIRNIRPESNYEGVHSGHTAGREQEELLPVHSHSFLDKTTDPVGHLT
jgi:hypothetical protein